MFFVSLLSRFCPAETAAKPRFLSYFCRGFVAAARAFSFAHRDRRKHKNSPGTPASASGLFARSGSKFPCGAFCVSLEDFRDSAQKSRLRGAQTLSKGIASHGRMWYHTAVVKRTCTVAPAFAHTKEGDCMKNSDFLAVTGWVFSLVSLLIAFYMLGKGI